jgi:hypothetical protein
MKKANQQKVKIIQYEGCPASLEVVIVINYFKIKIHCLPCSALLLQWRL